MLRGFGFTFDIRSGTVRRWYISEDGVKRWADSNLPCDGELVEAD